MVDQVVKYSFTKGQFEEIKFLLNKRFFESREDQKKTRARIRKLGFNISDYFNGFSDIDFQNLLNTGQIYLINEPRSISATEYNLEKAKPIFAIHTKSALPPVVDCNTEFLVLGTMPGENSLIHQQYYNDPNNQFWTIIAYLFNNGVKLKNYSQKIEILMKNKIGLWDVISTCDREGSSDKKIKNPILNDFREFFKTYPKIHTLIFNGQDSFNYFKTIAKIKENKILVLSSTSSANTHKTFEEKLDEWRTVFIVGI